MLHRGVMFQYFEWYGRNDGGHWRELAEKAVELANLGTTAVWLPPAYKCLGGENDTGYGVYDLYDLGEFDQKGTVRTKYGTKDEYVAAVKAIQDAGMHAYADVVLNHRMGADAIEEVEVEEIALDNRVHTVSGAFKIKTWCKFDFPGRGETYSPLKYSAKHFNAFSNDADRPDENHLFRVKGKQFSEEVSTENGNFDYLMGCDVDVLHPEVWEDLVRWGKWTLDTIGVHGFRLDAVKHIPHSFYRDWLQTLKEQYPDREIFAVAEYWTGELDEIRNYIHFTNGSTRMFDVPLHYNFCKAAAAGRDYDLRTIFDGTLAQADPVMAVTFVDNHDSQPGQSLESWVPDWFKPLAYALILLRQEGYPCIFYGDYFGNSSDDHKLTSHRRILDDMLDARRKYTHGEQIDYFDHDTCIGWTWTGDEDHPGAMVVVMSNGDGGFKKVKTFHAKTTFRDVTGAIPDPITTDDEGEAEFRCSGGSVSVWCSVG